jgi:hypothetical protein
MNVKKEEHTIEDHKLWNLISEAWDALSEHFEPAVERLIQTVDLSRKQWSLLLAILTCEPEPASAVDLMVRNPYTSADEYQARLAASAAQGYLIEIEPGSYRLSQAGRRETERLIVAARAAMVAVDPLPKQDSLRLADRIARLVHACLETPPPPDSSSIQASYKIMPPIDPPLPYTEQGITCLSAYRDDSHLAAWQLGGLTATAFETLSILWRNEAKSLDEICVKMVNRGYERETYQWAVNELRERNFLRGLDTALMVTESGRLFRNEVEEETNRFFFAPWDCLDYLEKTDMAGLLIRLKNGLQRKRPG